MNDRTLAAVHSILPYEAIEDFPQSDPRSSNFCNSGYGKVPLGLRRVVGDLLLSPKSVIKVFSRHNMSRFELVLHVNGQGIANEHAELRGLSSTLEQ